MSVLASFPAGPISLSWHLTKHSSQILSWSLRQHPHLAGRLQEDLQQVEWLFMRKCISGLPQQESLSEPPPPRTLQRGQNAAAPQ